MLHTLAYDHGENLCEKEFLGFSSDFWQCLFIDINYTWNKLYSVKLICHKILKPNFLGVPFLLSYIFLLVDPPCDYRPVRDSIELSECLLGKKRRNMIGDTMPRYPRYTRLCQQE